MLICVMCNRTFAVLLKVKMLMAMYSLISGRPPIKAGARLLMCPNCVAFMPPDTFAYYGGAPCS